MASSSCPVPQRLTFCLVLLSTRRALYYKAVFHSRIFCDPDGQKGPHSVPPTAPLLSSLIPPNYITQMQQKLLPPPKRTPFRLITSAQCSNLKVHSISFANAFTIFLYVVLHMHMHTCTNLKQLTELTSELQPSALSRPKVMSDLLNAVSSRGPVTQTGPSVTKNWEPLMQMNVE